MLVDTANWLERTHSSSVGGPTVLVTAETTNLSPKLCSFWSSLVPTQLTLAPSTTRSVRSWQSTTNDEAVVSAWSVAASSSCYKTTTPSKEYSAAAATTSSAVEYAIVRSLDSDMRIVWTETAAGA
jgi:hypothetical protein